MLVCVCVCLMSNVLCPERAAGIRHNKDNIDHSNALMYKTEEEEFIHQPYDNTARSKTRYGLGEVTLKGMLTLMEQQTLDRQQRDKQIDEERKLWEESLNKERDQRKEKRETK